MSPVKIICNNCALTGKALAEHFNSHFANIDVPSSGFPDAATITNSPAKSLFLDPTDEQEICRTFMNLNNSKALDVDNIQIKPVKYVLQFINLAHSHIFNFILESGVFLDKMKKARVTVLFKSDERDEAANYRPISVIPVFSKGLEK